MKTLSAISLLFTIILFASCDEDTFVTHVEIKDANFPACIALSAILDTDSGRLTMALYEAQSLARYNPARERNEIIGNGTITLYRNNEQVWTLTGAFDLTINKGGASVPNLEANSAPNDYSDIAPDGTYRRINVTGIPAEAGSEYRLEVAIAGYDKVVATAIMPSDPDVSNVAIDMEHPTAVNSAVYLDSNGYSSGSGGEFYPINLTMTDNNPSSPNYYEMGIEVWEETHNLEYPTTAGNYIQPTSMGVSNPLLVQDNPLYEQNFGDVLNFDGSEQYDAYMFYYSMLMSDISFGGGSAKLKLLTSLSAYGTLYNEHRPEYNAEINGVELSVERTVNLLVKHISTETFRHYRSLVLQDGDMGMFSEPVSVVSNVENGYGCFSLQNTRRILMKEYSGYYYPEWWNGEDVYYY
ncbi:MAG: DUF4249 domain-containing protein [Cytophagaceae bacterium]|nr:DUF4249 domain-containing protein [Cytophagaceae bacterium]